MKNREIVISWAGKVKHLFSNTLKKKKVIWYKYIFFVSAISKEWF